MPSDVLRLGTGRFRTVGPAEPKIPSAGDVVLADGRDTPATRGPLTEPVPRRGAGTVNQSEIERLTEGPS